MSETTLSTKKKLDELYELIGEIEIALLTTRRKDGLLVTRPMATQDHGPLGDLWFVTDVETHKIDELEADPHVSVGYLNPKNFEWVSVSGTARISQDRDRIKELYQDDWKMWFEDEGGQRDGGPDDPRLALIVVEAVTATYFKNTHSKPRVLFELARGRATGTHPDLGRQEHLSATELDR